MTTLEQAFPIGSNVAIKHNPETFKEYPAIVVGHDRGNIVVTFPDHYNPDTHFIIRPEDAILIDSQARLVRAAGYMDAVIKELNHIGSSPKIVEVINEMTKAFSQLATLPELSADYLSELIIACIDNTEIYSKSPKQIYLTMKRNGMEINLHEFDTTFAMLSQSLRVFYCKEWRIWKVNHMTEDQEIASIESMLHSETVAKQRHLDPAHKEDANDY